MITDVWRTHQLVGLILACFFIACNLGQRLSPLTGLALAYTWVSALMVFQNPLDRYGGLQINMDVVSGRAFAAAVVVPIFVGMIGKRTLWLLLEVVTVLNAALLIRNGSGIFTAYSMDSAFCAMMIPSMWFRPGRRWNSPSFWESVWAFCCITIPAAAILMTSGSTAYAAAGVGLVTYLLACRRWRDASICLFLAMGTALALERGELLNTNGRWEYWQIFMEWWAHNASLFFGTGTGTFEWFGPMIESQRQLFIWMHNEYLQVMFEQGWLGFSIYGALFLECIWLARREPWLLASILATAVVMATQFPARMFVSQVFIFLLVTEAQCRRK